MGIVGTCSDVDNVRVGHGRIMIARIVSLLLLVGGGDIGVSLVSLIRHDITVTT